MSLKAWSTALLLAASLAAHAEPLRLLFAGDVMLADGPGRLIAAGGDPLAPFAGLLARADYRIGNLECAVARGGTADPEKIYSFRADPAALRVLQGRFDALSVANNHAGDFGRAASSKRWSTSPPPASRPSAAAATWPRRTGRCG